VCLLWQSSQIIIKGINGKEIWNMSWSGNMVDNKAEMIRKIIVMAVIGLSVFVMIYYPQMAVFAADDPVTGAQLVSNSVGKVYDILAAFVSSVGSIIVLWMLFEMGMAVQSQEGTMQANGIKRVGGGLIMVLAPQLISALI
jgi:protein-S-isoprenylcysteine O-methyltransferase Ste14